MPVDRGVAVAVLSVTGRKSGRALPRPVSSLRGNVARVELRDDRTTQHEIGSRTYVVAQVEPLDVDGVRTVEVGVGVWLVAFVALLPFYGTLQETGRTWWLWTCLAGFGLGLFGLEYCRRRRKARAEQAS
ncbi:DUF2530 domain-containing protein [Nocardioides piscis]|uniref:DUF2530 domain-containing protein n=1 Tax=Nocardioides piscis TaxID=2714938 RepID=A0A6G7YEW4_9ACTN|nr:DUF2530 domain-containing protein [Nocardioides piscis]